MKDHEGSVSFGGRLLINCSYADDIVVNAEDEEESDVLTDRLDTTTTRFKMEIGNDKIKPKTNNPNGSKGRSKLRVKDLKQ